MTSGRGNARIGSSSTKNRQYGVAPRLTLMHGAATRATIPRDHFTPAELAGDFRNVARRPAANCSVLSNLPDNFRATTTTRRKPIPDEFSPATSRHPCRNHHNPGCDGGDSVGNAHSADTFSLGNGLVTRFSQESHGKEQTPSDRSFRGRAGKAAVWRGYSARMVSFSIFWADFLEQIRCWGREWTDRPSGCPGITSRIHDFP